MEKELNLRTEARRKCRYLKDEECKEENCRALSRLIRHGSNKKVRLQPFHPLFQHREHSF